MGKKKYIRNLNKALRAEIDALKQIVHNLKEDKDILLQYYAGSSLATKASYSLKVGVIEAMIDRDNFTNAMEETIMYGDATGSMAGVIDLIGDDLPTFKISEVFEVFRRGFSYQSTEVILDTSSWTGSKELPLFTLLPDGSVWEDLSNGICYEVNGSAVCGNGIRLKLATNGARRIDKAFEKTGISVENSIFKLIKDEQEDSK